MPRSTGAWLTLQQRQPAMLSTVQPPDVRHPGPVVGAGSTVRPCGRSGNGSRYDEICLEVLTPDGIIERGYTYAHLVALPAMHGRRGWLLPVIGIAGTAAAILAVLQL